MGESRALCGETVSPSQAFRVLFSCTGAKGKEKWGYHIGTSSAVRLNLQMETGSSLKLKSAGRSAMWGALAEGCEEVHMLCSADCNDLLINNTFQLLAKPWPSLFNKFIAHQLMEKYVCTYI